MPRAVALLFLLSLPLLSQQTWLHSEEVALGKSIQSIYDYSLEDGRQVRFVPNRTTWPAVESWPKGKSLLLAYALNTGPVLVNPVDGKWVALSFVTENHPIDLMLTKCLDSRDGFTTSGMVECFDRSNVYWEAEIQRLLKLLASGLKSRQRVALQTAQQSWQRFYKAQVSADALIDIEGTISRVNRASSAATLKRDRAKSLAAIYAR